MFVLVWVSKGISFLTQLLRSYYLPEKIYKVPLNGFSTLRVDHIYFRFKGRAFERSFSLSGYDLSDSCKQYDVELYLKEPLPTVYYISGISLCKKENTTKQEKSCPLLRVCEALARYVRTPNTCGAEA